LIDWRPQPAEGGALAVLEAVGEFGERVPVTIIDGQVGGDFLVAAAEVLHEAVPHRVRA
jgi:hypothetical protein